MKFIRAIVVALFLVVSLGAATGDFVSCQILTSGTEAEYVLVGDYTGGTIQNRLGLGTNNDPTTGTPSIVFNWTTKGFDATGAATTPAWSAYGTIITNVPAGAYTISGSYTSGTFIDGEVVTQGTTGAKALVYTGQSSGPVLIVIGPTTFPAPDSTGAHTWVGGTSGAIFAPSATPTTYSGAYLRYDGTNTHIRVYLSDYISSTADDSAVTVTALSGFITKTAVPNNATTGSSVTNNSTISGFPKVLGNDTYVPFQIISGSTFSPRCVAFHSSATGGNPVACVVFSATDAHSHTVTSTVTSMTVDGTTGDALPVPEYIGSISTSTLTALDTITVTWKAYPWRGNSSSVLDTNSGGTSNTGTYGPKSWFNDKNSTYGIAWGVIDPSGNDGTGVIKDRAITPDNPTNIAAATPFATVMGVLAAGKTYNSTHNSNHNDTGGIQIYCRAGTSYKIYGASGALGATPKTWPVIQPAPSTNRAGVIFDNSSGDKNVPMAQWANVTINDNTAIGIDGGAYLWLNGAVLNPLSNGSAFVYSDSTITYITQCVSSLTNTGMGGVFLPYSNKQEIVALIRGCDLTNYDAENLMSFTVVGNNKKGTTSVNGVTTSTAGTAQWDNPIIYCNRFMNYRGTAGFFGRGGTANTTTVGVAFIQNVVEYTNNGSAYLLSLGADGTGSDSLTDPNNNYLIWNNTIVGQRANLSYNEYGSLSPARRFWSVQNNVFDNYNIKSTGFSTGITSITNTGTTANVTAQQAVMATGDIVVVSGASPSQYNGTFQITYTDSTHFTYVMASNPGGSASGTMTYNNLGHRRGNWDQFNGVLDSGNMLLQTSGIGATGLTQDLPGLRCYSGSSSATGYMQFVDREAYAGGGSTSTGNGNYNLQTSSPALGFQYRALIPYDLSGSARTSKDAPGAYHLGANIGNFFYLFQ